MTSVRLKVQECEVTGEIGLLLVGVNAAGGEVVAASRGSLIAHDIIEHQNGPECIGGVADELEALGALWYVRGDWGDWNREGHYHHSSEAMLKNEIESVFFDYYNRGFEFDNKNPLPQRAKGQFLEIFREIVASTNHKESFQDMGEECGLEEGNKIVRDFNVMAVRLLCTGAAKAHRRFRSQHKANTMFWNIAKAVDLIAKNLDECHLGQEYILTYTEYEAVCREVNNYGEW